MNPKISRAALVAAVLVSVFTGFFPVPALAGNADDVVAATQDLFVKMSARDLSGVARYIPSGGFSEIIPETNKLLQLDAKAFEGLFESDRKISLRAVDV